ncbi:YhcN/YlaJ family sporulation lipoprotein [Halalkalibacter alkalisediminis]|uniref:YhcN/YlaJ family sporulation lipoprotein n=1 Tax=Halalkalibacter alkalisediminis TaxID=935616 RepID=A0ABV6NGL1_9BACI|nr:YhcN/YlaJ family sporulation lipoprotein [Halalkalibacter alkalisediminis]
MKGIIQGLLVLCILCSCQMAEPQQDIKPLQLSTNAVLDQEQADEAKKIILSMEEVTEVKGVSDENNIYLAPKVKHFDRFRLKEIRKYGHDAVKKRYPDATVHVSTDQKIYMELEKLEQELKERTISEKRLKQRLKELDEMTRG